MAFSGLVGRWLRGSSAKVYHPRTISVHFVNMTTTGQITAGSSIINGLLNGTAAYYCTVTNCDITAYYFSSALLSITAPLPATTLLPITASPPIMLLSITALMPISTLRSVIFQRHCGLLLSSHSSGSCSNSMPLQPCDNHVTTKSYI